MVFQDSFSFHEKAWVSNNNDEDNDDNNSINQNTFIEH